MSPLQLAKERRANSGLKQHRRLAQIISYPPASTGTNYNVIDKVEHEPHETVIWKKICSPDGHFVFDYELKSNRKRRRTRCPSCENFLEAVQKKCLKCKAETRKARNRRHYQVLKARFKTDSP